jgi:hypothetical protein
MEPLSSEPPDLMEIMVPRWIYNRMAAPRQRRRDVDDERIGKYVVAVPHMNTLFLTSDPVAPHIFQ